MILLAVILLLSLSIAVLLQQRLLNAVILLGVFSLVSSVVYFLAGAPDVAVTEGAIGVAFVTFIYVLALSDQGKLHVIAEEVRPFLFQEKGELKGAELELLRGFAREMSLELEVEFVGHQELTSLVGGRRADLIAGAYFSEYISREGLESSNSYYSAQLTKIHNPETEHQGSVGILKDFDLREVPGSSSANIVQFDSIDGLIKAYSNDQIGGFIADSGRMSSSLYRLNSRLREKSKVHTLGEVNYVFAIAEKEQDLVEKMNEYLRDLKNSGELSRILSEYFGDEHE